MFTPRSVIRNIQIDPGNQAIPRLVIEANPVMSLTEQLDQFTRAGMILERFLQMVIAFRPRAPDKGV